VDEKTAPVVQKIFSMCVAGLGPTMIANRLKELQILTPVMYEYRKSGTAVTALDTDRPYDWNAKTVADILSREDYIGNTVNCRFTVPSYKDKRKMKRDPSGHIRFEHTHEPIIDMQTWETVQRLRQGKRRPASTGETSKYSGLLFCADCGSKMYFYHKRADDPKGYSFKCSHYRNNVKEKCTPHRIREAVLDEILLEELRRITYTARTKERQIQALQQAASDVEKFIGLAKKYTRITEFTPEILHTFVSKIVIHERRERFKQNTEQQIDIYFRYIGNTAGL